MLRRAPDVHFFEGLAVAFAGWAVPSILWRQLLWFLKITQRIF